jgi:hypothetical protein
MPYRAFRKFLLIILLIGGNAYAQTQLPKCVLFGFGNCIGTLRFSNGDIYTGEFNYGKPNGQGAFTYGNGDSYSGTVAEGQRHGSGIYTSTAGDKYVGQFSEGKFDGAGTYYFLANNRSKGDVYTGEFSSNTFNGQGRYTHSNGQAFVGSFSNGRKVLAEAAVAVKPEPMAVAVAVPKQITVETLTVVAAPKVVAISAPVADKVPMQVPASVAKADPIPASVETSQQLYGSKDSAVQAPQAAESRTGELVTTPSERSKWYVTGGLVTSNSYSGVTGCKSPSCSTSADDLGVMIGFGKDLTKNIGIEASLYSLGTTTSQWTSSSEKLKNDYYVFTLGATFSKEITKKINLNVGGGYYTSLVNSTYTSSTLNTNTDYQYDNSFVHLGAVYEIDDSASIGIKLKRFTSRYYSITDPDGFYGYEIALKYSAN